MQLQNTLQAVFTELDGLSMSAKARRALNARLEELTSEIDALASDYHAMVASEARLSSALDALNIAVASIPGSENNIQVKLASSFCQLAVQQSGAKARPGKIQITRSEPVEAPSENETAAESAGDAVVGAPDPTTTPVQADFGAY